MSSKTGMSICASSQIVSASWLPPATLSDLEAGNRTEREAASMPRITGSDDQGRRSIEGGTPATRKQCAMRVLVPESIPMFGVATRLRQLFGTFPSARPFILRQH
ncbi:hypothetical protein G5V57_25755 [Nordella sp. HKS 07]|uniref:hypothetical protein n=1 Tax=Nordella sp. HKS 07 TaxID=2712222 RepID=UPI0013E16A21|nr:hypothetical protein [Nordella sp. HKS 07]QIG50838.1 hypothetical protein G5V57_25755 [Nordella sp. HKS 07]